MLRNPLITCAIATLWLAGCTQKQGAQPEQQPQVQVQAQQRPMDTLRPGHHFVSYYKLLARPEEYGGRRILVLGVLSISGDENIASLYPNMDSFHYQVKMEFAHARIYQRAMETFRLAQWQVRGRRGHVQSHHRSG